MIASLYQSPSCVNITGRAPRLIMHCPPEMVRVWRELARLGYNGPTLRIPNARQSSADFAAVLAFDFLCQCSTAPNAIPDSTEIHPSKHAEGDSRARAYHRWHGTSACRRSKRNY